MADEAALKLSWAFGVSPVQNGVVYLADDTRERVFYASSNTAIIQARIGRRPLTLLPASPRCPALLCVRADVSLLSARARVPAQNHSQS